MSARSGSGLARSGIYAQAPQKRESAANALFIDGSVLLTHAHTTVLPQSTGILKQMGSQRWTWREFRVFTFSKYSLFCKMLAKICGHILRKNRNHLEIPSEMEND